MKFICDTEDKLDEVVQNLLERIKEEDNVVVALYGDLGSGKTTFTKHLAKQLQVSEVITSPTFVIQKRFNVNFNNFTNLYHLDVYRLKDESELSTLNWNEILSQKGNLIVIEWPEIIEKALPKNTIKLNFTTVDESTRKIEVVE